MNDTSAKLAVHTRITSQSGHEVRRDYSLDLHDPQLDRFMLTDDERHRVEQLLSQALAVWDVGTSDEDAFAEPLKTLLDVTVEIIGDALGREVESGRSRKAVSL